MRTTGSARGLVSATLALLLLLAACTDDPSPVGTDEPSNGGETEPSDDPEPDDLDEPGEDDEPVTAEGPHGSITLSGVQQVHLAGVVVAVSGITIDDHGDIYVEFDAQNVNDQRISLAQHHVRLVDDVGNGYRVLPDPDNRALRIPSDHRAEVSLAFEGPIDPAATRLALGFNGNGELLDTDASPPTTTYPTFAFHDLPLPGVGLDDEAGDPDAPVGIDLPETIVTIDDAVYEGPLTQLTIEVREIRVTPLVVELDVFARNDDDRRRDVIQREPLLWAEVDGDLIDGRLRYATLWSEDEGQGRESMTLEPGEELHATLSFRGSVPAEATGLRFGIGAVRGSDMRAGAAEELGVYPMAVFTGLPLPERGNDED